MIRHYEKLLDTVSRVVRAGGGFAHRVSALFKNARPVLQNGRLRSAGFTLIEMAFACEVIMLLTLIGFNETRRVREHAKVAACLNYQAAVQRSLWGDYAFSGDFPDKLDGTLTKIPPCSLGNDFNYKGGLVDGLFGEYYLRCNHDHSYVGVLFIDSGSYLAPKPIYNLATARGNI